MECTQRLECTQDLYDSPVEKTCPEQIGFLGICGTKYPVKRGPNKVGRDPQTCQIVLQLDSISRQHAVINILNKMEFMLMDLDSANKTKLLDKTLQPYLPHPLKNGDTVQFGKIFGIFRLLEEDTELPMTQALDIPDTPVSNRHVTRLHNPATTVPESPEVSDRDDSFIAPSQPKLHKQFKDDANHFIKPATRTISIQPIGSKKIDNVYWNSSKKSTSFGSSLDDSSKSINGSATSLTKPNDMSLYDMETQAPMDHVQNVSIDAIHTANTQMPDECKQNDNIDNIYNANTQIPSANKHNVSEDSIHNVDTQVPNACNPNVSIDSIYTANTQAPLECNSPCSINNADTQMPAPEKLPNFPKVQNQFEMEFDICVANKENDKSIFNAETQAFANTPVKTESINVDQKNNSHKNTSKSSHHTSEDEILFDDIDNEVFKDDFESQSLLPESPKTFNNKNKVVEKHSEFTISLSKPGRSNSGSSTDCEDIEIAPTQQLPIKQDEDLTDCEDDDNKKTDSLPESSNTKLEEMLTQVILHEGPSESNNVKYNSIKKIPAQTNDVPFEDMLTQVIEEDEPIKTIAENLNFEDMPTQIITEEEELSTKKDLDDLPTQVLPHEDPKKLKNSKIIPNELMSPFKVPLVSPRKAKRKDLPKLHHSKEITVAEANSKKLNDVCDKDDNYYEATQDILEDLCTQQLSPEILPIGHEGDEIVPSSVEDFKTGDYKLPGLDYDISPKTSDSNLDEKLHEFVTTLSKEQIQDMIGVQTLKRQGSDLSDSEATPRKVHPLKLFETDLPNSQEIKTSVSLHYKSNLTETSSESETENETEDQFTPILYRKKRRPKVDAKLDLIKKLNVEALPSRISTRVRKPAPKLQESDGNIKKRGENILKPKFLTEQEGDISNEIIIENITRLKTKNDKNEKNKSNTVVNNVARKSKNDIKNKSEHNAKEKRKSVEKKEDKNSNKREDNSTVSKSSGSKTSSDVVIDLTTKVSKRPTRSTRSKDKQSNKAESSPKEEDSKRRTRPMKKEHDTENSTEVRRSRRQKSYKEKKENDTLIKVKITKPPKREVRGETRKEPLERSAVYSVSPRSGAESPRVVAAGAESPRVVAAGAESPRGVKRGRGAAGERPPSPKRTRSNYRRQQHAPPQQHRVMFTAFPYEEVKNKLESLGAQIVSDVTQCTVLVTLHIKRTFKLLCAVGRGTPVVGAAWLQACADRNQLVDPWLYLLKDEAAEQRFKFSLQRTLTGRRNFLAGCNVSCTPSVRPAAAEMMLIVECSGGTWREGGARWLCVSSAADRALWPALAARGAALVSSELVLGGVLRQRLDVAAARLA